MPHRAANPPLSHSSSYAAAQRRQQMRSGGIAAYMRRQQKSGAGTPAALDGGNTMNGFLDKSAHFDRGLDSDPESDDAEDSDEGGDLHADSEEEELRWLEDEDQVQHQAVHQLGAEDLSRPIAHLRLLGAGSSNRVPALPHRPDKAYDVEVHSDLEDDEDEDAHGHFSPGQQLNGSAAKPQYPSRFNDASSDSSSSLPDEQDDADRLAWQDMLSNVLQGDVLNSEKDRLAGSLAHQLDDSAGRAKYQAAKIWIGVRASVRQRSVEAEQRFLQEARAQIPAILNEVIGFKVRKDATFDQASEQINALLNRVHWVASLFPSFKALRISEPSWDAETMLDRINTLQSWTTITNRLHLQLNILQRWTGSDHLEVTQPNNETIDTPPLQRQNSTSSNPPEGPSSSASSVNGADQQKARILDTSNFIERMLKQESLSSLFQKRIINDIFPLLENAKETAIESHARFQAMGLPSFEEEFITLVNFPMRLMREALRLRLDSGSRVNKDDGNLVLIDQLTDDFRAGLELATTMKKTYLTIVADALEEGWTLPNVREEDALDKYDTVLSEALKFFFRLLHWKLKSNNRSIYLKETEIVEAEWEFLTRGVDQIDGGDLLVAEHFSMLTNKLIQRVVSYVNESMEVLAKREMDAPTTVRWFNQALDNVRVRHRKLLRFGKALVQRFENACEFFLGSADVRIDLGLFIAALCDSGHFLIYNGTSEQNGLYMIGSADLHDRPDLVQRMLTRCFVPSTQPDYVPQDDEEMEGQYDAVRYVLILAPHDPFIWTGRVMNLNLPATDLDMRDKRVRIVAEGPDGRLAMAKKLFLTLFPAFRGLVVTDKQAHFARVNRDIKKIKLANLKLCEAVVLAPKDVQRVTAGNEALVAPYYAFAADVGQRSLRSFETKYKVRIVPDLQRFAIQWLNFVSEDCTPSEGRTFKWAVSALEFVRLVTKGDYIFRLNMEDFGNLRSGVASCMTLLISHFDILGARGAVETRKAKEKADAETQEARRLIQNKLEALRSGKTAPEYTLTAAEEEHLAEINAIDSSIGPKQWRWLKDLQALDKERYDMAYDMGMAGRVLDTSRSEGRELLTLASSAANVHIKWQQGRFIGSGTYGTVYMGYNLENGSVMAVKEIRFQDSPSANSLISQVKDEMTVMQMLRHPNIVEYIGIETHRDKVYIFEEYCQGGSLAKFLEGNNLEEAIVRYYANQLVDGLVYLHSRGVIHRDIKPENILLDHVGNMKLCDFGSAKVLANKSKTLAKTRRGGDYNSNLASRPQGSLNGTPMYMAPEMIKGETVGREGASDVWSLGCVLLECSTGKRPWAGLDNEWAIMFHIGIAKEHPPLPDESQLSAEGIDFIRGCLNIDASLRPTADELYDHPWLTSARIDSYVDISNGSMTETEEGDSTEVSENQGASQEPQKNGINNNYGEPGLSEIAEGNEDDQ